MNLNVADIFFSKYEISIYEDLFGHLCQVKQVPESTISTGQKPHILRAVIMQLLTSHLRLSTESQSMVSLHQPTHTE